LDFFKNFSDIRIGLLDGAIPASNYPFLGSRPNTYAISNGYNYVYDCYLAGEHCYSLSEVATKNNGSNVYGCDLLINPEYLGSFFPLHIQIL
jgi:hypothetical protein